MLPVGALKTATQKRQLLANAIKGIRKANKLGQFKMLRNNTCDDCGHYMTTHNEKGCQAHVWSQEKTKPVQCPCTRRRESSTALHTASVRG